jgi:sugar lactone lactonase YvrE
MTTYMWRIYVANSSKQTVLRYNPVSGAFIGTFVAAGNGLSFPMAMTFGPDGNLYVADWDAGVRQFNGSTGVPMPAITTGPTGGALNAYDVKFGPDGNIYVSDMDSNTILKYNGSTLAFMSVFATPPAVSSISISTPHGIAFSPNGNLYAICEVYDMVNLYNQIYEFSGGSGSLVTSFGGTTLGDALMFGRDGFIYIPEGQAINRYNPEFGYLQNAFTTDSRIRGSFIVLGGPGPFDQVVFAPYAGTKAQTIRLTVVDGPVWVPPGVAVEALLGFANEQGITVGPTLPVTLGPGQTVSLDLDLSTVISSGRTEVRPFVTLPPGAVNPPGGNLEASVEVFETAKAIGSVFGRGAHSIPSAPMFVPQGVPYGQSMRMTAVAPPDNPCDAVLSFADPNGNPVGPTKSVQLAPGNMTTLDFNANTLTGQSGQRIEIQPMVSLISLPGGVASACQASVEVYDQHSGRTATRQDSGGSC